jgi:hypothetical protein
MRVPSNLPPCRPSCSPRSVRTASHLSANGRVLFATVTEPFLLEWNGWYGCELFIPGGLGVYDGFGYFIVHTGGPVSMPLSTHIPRNQH